MPGEFERIWERECEGTEESHDIIHSVFQLSFEACTSQVQAYTFTQTLL